MLKLNNKNIRNKINGKIAFKESINILIKDTEKSNNKNDLNVKNNIPKEIPYELRIENISYDNILLYLNKYADKNNESVMRYLDNWSWRK